MKLTLLSLVQSYMNRTSDFPVQSIDEVETSQQAAMIAEEVYYDFIQKFSDWEFKTEVGTLDSVADLDRPNYLRLPDEVQKVSIKTLQYNSPTEIGQIRYKDVTWVEPEEFLRRLGRRSSTANNTQVVEDFGGTSFVIHNNKHPDYCTSFDGTYVVFDSYHKDWDDTLHEENSRVIYTKEDVFLLQDDFVIPIPDHLSGLFKDMFLVECYENLLQESAPPSVGRRLVSRMATAQQQSRRTGSMNKGKTRYGR